MATKIQHKRTSTFSAAWPTLVPGELAFNGPQLKIALGDPNTGAAVELLAVRFFSTASSYATNDFIAYSGTLLRAVHPVAPGAYNAADWAGAAAGVPEAPLDGKAYLRQNAAWAAATLASIGAVEEAPNDGKAYSRKSIAWAQLTATDVTYGAGSVSDALGNMITPAQMTSDNVTNTSGVPGVTVSNALVGLQSSIALKAPLASPAFTGTPTAPTPPAADNSTKVPTTAWVQSLSAGKASIVTSDVPPATPTDNSLWWESDTAKLYLRYNDGNSSQWVQVNAAAGMGGYVTKIGDTMTGPLILSGDPTLPLGAVTKQYSDLRVLKTGDTMTGNLVIAPAGITASLTLNKSVGSFANNLTGRANGLARWVMQLGSGVLESTGNVGSDFGIIRYDDSGAPIDTPLSINRASGSATFSSIISAPPTGIYGLTVQPPVGGASLLLIKSAGNYPVAITSQTAGKARWQMVMGSGDETGSGNGGGDFYLQNYNDAGGILLNALTIARSSGQATFGTTMRANGFNCRTGVSGSFGGSNFNFNWTTTAVQVWIDNSNLGNMTYTSDYRVKKDVAPLTPMWETVKALRPISYTHKDYTPPSAVPKEDGSPADPMFTNDDTERWGFIAHELQETLTESAATGFKDSPEHIQSPNPWTMLAAVTKALQEAMARIENLEARIV